MDLSTLPKLDGFHQQTTVYIQPDKLPKFWEAFTPVFEKTAAAPECLYLEVFEDPAVPGKVTWVANWNRSPEWLMTEHINKDYYKPYRAATEPLYTTDRENVFLKREKPYIAAKKANFERHIGEHGEGFCLHVMIEIRPECVEEFQQWMMQVFEPVVSEPECLHFEIFSDPSAPWKLSWIENWAMTPEQFMKNQMTKEYYKPYLAATEPMFTTPRVFEILVRKPGFVAHKEANFEGTIVGELGR